MAYDPPPFMPHEPFLLGVGVVFNLLNRNSFEWELHIMFLAPIANDKTAASWGGGQKKLKKLTLTPLLDGASLGGPLGAR